MNVPAPGRSCGGCYELGGGGKGGSYCRTNQPYLKSRLTPLGLSVVLLKVGRKSTKLDFYT